MHEMPMQGLKKKTSYVWLTLSLSAMLMVVAFLNGFPLATSDTGSYINHAFDFQIPADRSPFYGIFTAMSSLRLSLWLTVVVQALLVSWALVRYIDILSGGAISAMAIWGIGIAVALFTYAPWVTAYIMPDVFTGLLLLAIIFFLHKGTTDTPMTRLADTALLLLSLSVHNSHFIILLLVSGLLCLVCLHPRFRAYLTRSIYLAAIAVGWILFVCTIHWAKGFGFTMSAGSHVFMMGKLSETGILKDYLTEACPQHDYKLCAYKDHLPAAPWDFLWQAESPLYKTGGWDSSKQEYTTIIKSIFSNPHYAARYATHAGTATLQQMMATTYTDMPLPKGSSPWLSIQKYFPKSLPAFEGSLQNRDALPLRSVNLIHTVALLLSCAAMLYCLPRMRQRAALGRVYLLIVLFLFCNAFVTASFANVLARLQTRVFWVLPVTNIIIVASYLYQISRPQAVTERISD